MRKLEISLPVALVASSVILGACLIWHAEKSEAAALCAGFLASNDGAGALDQLATVKVANEMGRYTPDNAAIRVWRREIEAAGCHLRASL